MTPTNTKRDAAAAVQGFYYQIQVTIQRWLALGPLDELYCERGEDVEIVIGALSSAASVENVFEQVKVRSALSLRSPEIVAATIRYFESIGLGARPTVFRFLTTARASREQRCSFPRKLPGLVAWNLARLKVLDKDDLHCTATEALRLLVAAKRPTDIPEKLFKRFGAHIRKLTPTQFATRFIDPIEWAINADAPDSLRQDLSQSLIDGGYAKNSAEAATALALLIAHVFHLLTQRRAKELVSSDIHRVLKEAALPDRDKRVLEFLEVFAAHTSSQLAAIESKTDNVLAEVRTGFQIALTNLLPRVEDIRLQQFLGVVPIADEPAKLDPSLIRRDAFVRDVQQTVTRDHACVLLGPVGMGKTTVAALLIDQWRTSARHWITLRQRLRVDARKHLAQQLVIQGHLDVVQPAGFSQLARDYATELSGGLLVLDNAPDLVTDSLLAEQCSELVEAIVAAGGHILVTSHARWPESLLLPSGGQVTELVVPALTVTEIKELLDASSVDDTLLAGRLPTVIHATTSGHPTLVAAVVRYVRVTPDFEEHAITSLVTGDSIRPLRVETRRRLRELLHDDSRELLDRLSLFWNPFDKETAHAIAAIDPRLRGAGDAIEELRGVWLHSVGNELEISPLLKGVGADFLDPAVQQRVHGEIARRYMRDRTVTPSRAINILFHLMGGCAWRDLTGFSMQLIRHVDTPEHARFFDVLLGMTAFPAKANVPLGTRIALRALQARIALVAGRKPERWLRDLRALTETVDEDGVVEAFIAWLMVGPFNRAAPGAISIEGFRRALSLSSRVPLLRDSDLPVPLEALLWATIPNLNTEHDVEAFIDTLTQMASGQLRRAFAEERLGVGVEIVANKCVSVELALPEQDRNWERVLGRLDRLIEAGRRAGIAVVADAAEREKAAVFAAFLDRLTDALALLDVDLDRRSSAERVRRHHAAASLLADAGRFEPSLARWDVAFNEPLSNDYFTYGDAARRAAEIAAKLQQWRRGASFGVKAILPLRRAGLKFDALDMLIELAWLHWQAGSPRRCVATMSHVVNQLVAEQDIESPRYRETFRKAGMLLGWIATVDVRDPSQAWGGMEFATPFPGWASRSRPAMATMSTPMSLPLLTYLAGRVMAEAGMRRAALRQLERARAIATQQQATVVECMVSSAEAEVYAALGDLARAVPLSLAGMRMLLLDKGSSESDFDSTVSVSNMWTSAPSERRRDVQGMFFWNFVAPSIVGGLARRVDDDGFCQLLAELREALTEQKANVEDLSYWLQVVASAEAVIRPVPVMDIRAAVQRHSNDTRLLLIDYLALMRSPSATLSDVCGSQIVCLTTFSRNRTWLTSVLADLPVVIIDFWREAAKSRAYSMSGPALFLRTMEGVTEYTIQNAARVLLAAHAATGIRASSDLIESLSKMARGPGAE